MPQPTQRSYLTGLMGSGIGPSLSPALHQREADRHRIRLVYRILDIDGHGEPAAAVAEFMRAARTLGFDGLNVTHPCKQLVIEHLDALSPTAAALGAVNTVVLKGDRAVGHNTDAAGFANSFARHLPGAPTGRVVQLGAGGAGAAVAHALLTLGCGTLQLLDTDPDRSARLADALTQHFGADRAQVLDRARLPAALDAADGLVHATPTGMAAHPGTPLPTRLLHPGLWVADIVYRPLETELLRDARALGCRTLGGGGMVALQAADAFELFTGLAAHTELMLADLAELTGRSDAGSPDTGLQEAG
ncbi:shikimate dehydrogenase [Streptacidiphilus carbonis]|uniref:shikimate dehydrogenase n=1 Tax=Streptacidiphilus carbonis TaxID=105422 RepID=UPI0005AACE33|nr:shikimate dehydrogenase [Streptacidiphilus carbonis]